MSTTTSGRDYLIKSFRTEISCAMNGLYLKGVATPSEGVVTEGSRTFHVSLNGSLSLESLFHSLVSQISPVHSTVCDTFMVSFIYVQTTE